MSTTHQVDLVEAYIAEVRERLVGVPEEERTELLDDVTAHVREVADEHGADQLRDRLGSPQQFGDELRTSAGFTPADAESSGPSITARFDRQWAALRATPPGKWVEQEWPRLEPAWWLLRGAALVSLAMSLSEPNAGLIPRIGDGRMLGLLAVAAGAVTSYILGSRRPANQSRRVHRARIAGEVALAFFAVVFLAQASDSHVVYYDSSNGSQPDACLRDSAGRAIGNLFAFDATGKAIPQVFLTDQAGRAIDNLCPDQADSENPNGPAKTTYARDVNGAPVYNVFPRAQQRATSVDPNTGEVTGTSPVPAPAVVLPQLAPDGAPPFATTTTAVPAQP